jgi:hypothetical protein
LSEKVKIITCQKLRVEIIKGRYTV